VAGISLAVTQFIHGLGVVTTKKMKNTTTLHVTYFVGVMLLVGNALLMPTFEKSSDYHWPNIS
jgi:drug/metabolite transporter (DMT)-like permease